MTNTALNIETQSQTVATTHALSKEKWQMAVMDFKKFNLDPDNKPFKDSTYGTKYQGEIRFITYILYAMLREKDFRKTTHNVNSESFVDRISALKAFSEGKSVGNWVINDEIALAKKCFSSLTTEELKAVIKSSLK